MDGPPNRAAAITVAIATLDRPAGLARCLDALLAGQVLPAEVIIVDQSRDDATRAILAARSPFPVPVRYVRQQRRGLAASRNAAIALARGPIVAVTDDDCVPGPEWVAALGRAFGPPSAPAAVTGPVLPLGPPQPGLYEVSSHPGRARIVFRGKILPWLVGSGGNFAVQRAWLAHVGGYDPRLGAGSPGRAAEDMDLFYRLLRAGACIQYEPEARIYHERQSRARRLATRWSYGYGMGAFCGLWLRRRDLYALAIGGRWLAWQSRELLAALAQRDRGQTQQRWLSVWGTIQGLLYGLSRR